MTTIKAYKNQKTIKAFDLICPICKRPESECFKVWKKI